jgi:hypothetical protein
VIGNEPSGAPAFDAFATVAANDVFAQCSVPRNLAALQAAFDLRHRSRDAKVISPHLTHHAALRFNLSNNHRTIPAGVNPRQYNHMTARLIAERI